MAYRTIFRSRAHASITLMNLFHHFEGSQCLEAKDKIYALRSLCRDGSQIRVDYTVDEAVLFLRMMIL